MAERKKKRTRQRFEEEEVKALRMANPNKKSLRMFFDYEDEDEATTSTSTSLRNISGSSQLSVASSSAEELNAALAPNDNAYGDWLEGKIKADKIKADNEKKQNQQAADAGTQTYFVPEKTVTFGGKKRKRKKKRKTRKKRGGMDNMCSNFAEKLSGKEYYQNRFDVTRKEADEYCNKSESKNHECDINTGNCVENKSAVNRIWSLDQKYGKPTTKDLSSDRLLYEICMMELFDTILFLDRKVKHEVTKLEKLVEYEDVLLRDVLTFEIRKK